MIVDKDNVVIIVTGEIVIIIMTITIATFKLLIIITIRREGKVSRFGAWCEKTFIYS